MEYISLKVIRIFERWVYLKVVQMSAILASFVTLHAYKQASL